MRLRKTTASFVAEARAKHGDTYDYSQVEYSGIKTAIKVVCPLHGPFAIMADNHLQGKGCQACSKANASRLRTQTTGTFTEKAIAVHGAEKYNYSLVNYVGTKVKVTIICPQHGAFRLVPSNHLQGAGCKRCGNDKLRKSQADFIAQARAIHGERYDFGLVSYQQSGELVTIVCPQHGPFEQTPYRLLRGHGCSKCTNETRRPCWSARAWASRQKGRVAQLYVVKMSHDGEAFYKAGITLQGVDERFKSGCPYSVEPLAVFGSENAISVFQAEAIIKKRLKALRYRPKTRFCGHTECYTDAGPILALLGAQEGVRQLQ